MDNPDNFFTTNKVLTSSTIQNILIKINTYNEDNLSKTNSNLVIKSLPHTVQHKAKINLVLVAFHYCLTQYAKKKTLSVNRFD